jgi:D-alanine transaminase
LAHSELKKEIPVDAIGLIDGKIIALREKVIEIEDRGYQFGDGVYEVTMIYNRRPFALKLHMDRLFRSLRELKIPITYSFEELARFHGLLIEKSGLSEATVYLQITRGVAPRSHTFPKSVTPRLTMSIQPFTAHRDQSESGAATIFVPDERWLRCDIKSINLLGNLLARERATAAGVIEAVMVRPRDLFASPGTQLLDGIVTEGTHTNFFAVKDGRLHTHPANHLILRGISRTIVLDQLAPSLGIPAVEEPFDVAFAKSADEAFAAGSTVEITPFISFDGAPVGNGKVGPITRRLMDAFDALIAKECGIHK